MPKVVIEREIAGAGKLPPSELQAISQKSCSGVPQDPQFTLDLSFDIAH